MSTVVRLSKKELIELIEGTEAAGCDASCLRGLLAEVEEEERLEKPARLGVPLKARLEEMTTEEHIESLRQQSFIEQGKDLECMVCHKKIDTLVSGTCENCFREWALTVKRR